MTGHSRYTGLPVSTVEVDDGAGGRREVAYLPVRVPPDPAATPIAAWHRIVPDDRLDLLAARYLGDPAAWWRIADANLALDPDELTGPDADGRVVAIAVPGV